MARGHTHNGACVKFSAGHKGYGGKLRAFALDCPRAPRVFVAALTREKNAQADSTYPGVCIFIQTFLLFIGSFVTRLGRLDIEESF